MRAHKSQTRSLVAVLVLLIIIQTIDTAVSTRKKGKQRKRFQPHKALATRLSNGRNPEMKSKNFINFDGNVFLERFGYLVNRPDHKHSLDVLMRAISTFQKFTGLAVTGVLDTTTVNKMRQPRCAVPDFRPVDRSRGRTDNSTSNSPLAYHAPGDKWTKRELTYKVVGYTRRLRKAQQLSAFASALKKWSNVVPLTFKLVTHGTADIMINFARGEHGDGRDNAFDGIGGTLAHAFFPGYYSISGDTHFDEDEEWTMGTPSGINLEIVAAHEFGHALGLDHSSNQNALMAATYQYFDNYGLHDDDVRGIQKLYGPRNGGSNPTTNRPTTKPPTTSKVTRKIPPPKKPITKRPTTYRPATKRPTTRRPSLPRYTRRTETSTSPKPDDCCSVRFDGLEQVHDGTTYAFVGDLVYTITNNKPPSAKRIDLLYPGAPISPGAVVYDSHTKHLFIFKGNRYWRFSGYRIDRGYPRSLPPHFHDVTAAMQWHNGLILLFKGTQFFPWAEGLSAYPAGYPSQINRYWKELPSNFDATFRGNNGYYYFFKDQKYWIFNSKAELADGYPRNVDLSLLNCKCPPRTEARIQDGSPSQRHYNAQPDALDINRLMGILVKVEASRPWQIISDVFQAIRA